MQVVYSGSVSMDDKEVNKKNRTRIGKKSCKGQLQAKSQPQADPTGILRAKIMLQSLFQLEAEKLGFPSPFLLSH